MNESVNVEYIEGTGNRNYSGISYENKNTTYVIFLNFLIF